MQLFFLFLSRQLVLDVNFCRPFSVQSRKCVKVSNFKLILTIDLSADRTDHPHTLRGIKIY